jgi:hypothetical protein
MIGLFTGLNPLNPSLTPTSMIMYEIGYANTRYLVNEIIKDGSNVVYFLVKDQLKNGGTQQMMRVDTNLLKWIATDIAIVSG